MIELATACTWAADRKNGVLITIRKDGRPQSSDITYVVDGTDFLISVTASRAKTKNMMRDPRVVLHLTEAASYSYLSFDGTVDLSAPTSAPDDATADQLVAYYRSVAGEHDDWDEYRAAMVAEGRLLVRFTPAKVVGQIN